MSKPEFAKPVKTTEGHESEPQAVTAWFFPGQGGQYRGMGLELHQRFPCARKIYDEVDEVAGRKISRVSFEGTDKELQETINTQPVVFAYILACSAVHEELNPSDQLPGFVAGHSLGEYLALVKAKVAPWQDIFKLVLVRAEGMQKASDNDPERWVMAALLNTTQQQQELLQSAIEKGKIPIAICNFNSSSQIVIAGSKDGLAGLRGWFRNNGFVPPVPLKVGGAFHTDRMASAVPHLEAALEQIEFKPAQIPIIANTTGQPIRDPKKIKEALTKQVTSPVQWHKTNQFFAQQNVGQIIELGEKGLLAKLTAADFGGTTETITSAGIVTATLWRRTP